MRRACGRATRTGWPVPTLSLRVTDAQGSSDVLRRDLSVRSVEDKH